MGSLSLRRAWIEIVSPDTFRQKSESLSLRRAWIEIASSSTRRIRYRPSRSPYGERGLKFDGDLTELAGGAGRFPYGERGLKFTAQGAYPVGSSRSPYGERGLKYRNYRNCAGFPCRSPYGERGLKYRHAIIRLPRGRVAFLTESVD